MKKKIILTVTAFLLITFAWPQSKIALVIGNSDYEQMPLKNPQNDAYDLSNALRALGFQVIQKTNLNQRQMEDAIREFKGRISPGDVALFYFSGHGTQVKGLNYLIPVGESVTNEIDVKYNCVEAGFVLDHMEQARSGINIVILDACRNNPFKGYRSANRGFAHMSAPTGSIIAYSTAPGKVAQDGSGRNSPFTKNLIEKINIAGLKIEEVFKEVRKDVASETGRQQIPWESSSLMGDFYFKGGAGDKPAINNQNSYNNEPNPIEETNANSGYFKDHRDGQSYRYVRIGNQVWMAENLNYRTSKSACYDNDKINCKKYGRLYTWDDAMKNCPRGWHIPSEEEWETLENTVGYDPGKKLKSKTGWYKDGEGTDEFDFGGKPGGYLNWENKPWYIRKYGYFWLSTEHWDDESAHYRRLGYPKDDVMHSYDMKGMQLSVRCIRDN